jgi:hypothetical protein
LNIAGKLAQIIANFRAMECCEYSPTASMAREVRGANNNIRTPLFRPWLLACAIVAPAFLWNAPEAMAQCVGGGGTTTCTGNPATFPSGGAAAVAGDATLNVNSLTANMPQRLERQARSSPSAPVRRAAESAFSFSAETGAVAQTVRT